MLRRREHLLVRGHFEVFTAFANAFHVLKPLCLVHYIWKSCESFWWRELSNKNGGTSSVSSVLTSSTGSCSFTNIIPGKYKIHASGPDLNVEVKGSVDVGCLFPFQRFPMYPFFLSLSYVLRGRRSRVVIEPR